MPLSLNEIKDRALAFSREWEGAHAEKAEAQTFWNEFFYVFGVSRRRLASFEEPVKRARKRFEEKGGGSGFIDLFWKGTLIAEHKSRDRDLDSAYKQALEYFEGIDWGRISPAIFGALFQCVMDEEGSAKEHGLIPVLQFTRTACRLG